MRMKAVRQRKPAASSAWRRPPQSAMSSRGGAPPAAISHEFDRTRHPGVDRMVGGFEGEHEQALLIGIDAVGSCIVVVDDAQIRRVEAGLRGGAHGPRGGEENGEGEN